MAGVTQRLANKSDVVGGTAAAARLRDEHGRTLEVVLAAEHGIDELARYEDGRVANVVVHVLEAHVHCAVVHGRQKHDVVATMAKNRLCQIKVDG